MVCKVCLLGLYHVGKTAIFNRIAYDDFNYNNSNTLGMVFKSLQIKLENDDVLKVEMFDTCGMERFSNLTRNYYKNCDIVILVISDQTDSLLYAQRMLNNLMHEENIKIISVWQNKKDLGVTHYSFLESLSDAHIIYNYEIVSALNNKENEIQTNFKKLCQIYYDKFSLFTKPIDVIKVHEKKNERKYYCC